MSSPEWADVLCEHYVDTGCLLTAMERVDITPSKYYRALADDAVFADRMRSVHREAYRTIELKALTEALDGNDRLLGLAVKQLQDEGEAAPTLTDEQITKRLQAVIARTRVRLAQQGVTISHIERVHSHDSI